MSQPPKVHRFRSTGEAYDSTQCRDDIRDGDVLVIEEERVVGFLVSAWPVAVTELHGELHGPLPAPAREYREGRYAESVDHAERIARDLGFLVPTPQPVPALAPAGQPNQTP